MGIMRTEPSYIAFLYNILFCFGCQLFSGGVINCMMRFYHENNKNDAIVVRVYGDDKAGEGLMARDNEVMVMQVYIIGDISDCKRTGD